MGDAPNCAIYRGAQRRSVVELVLRHLPEHSARKIMIKPNWVRHAENPCFPIEALVTSSILIRDVVEACLQKYKGIDEITIGDVPLQSCDWNALKMQAGLDSLIQRYRKYKKPLIRFLDLRREEYKSVRGFFEREENRSAGDPKGYRQISLDGQSFLEPISDQGARFKVSDYAPRAIESAHRKGCHRYMVAGSVLDCDLLINMPKMKTHQKAGITGALKNLVGINGEKAYLAHFRRDGVISSGDEFPPNHSWPVMLQTRIREALQKRSRWLFSVVRPGWSLLRRVSGIQTEGTPANLAGKFYVGSGSWYGNDTIWRMIYDLNKIILWAGENARIDAVPQRRYLAIMDGVVAGEGNGPLQPLPVDLGVLLFSMDPFLMDMAMAQLMGFDFRKIPSLSNYKLFGGGKWGSFDPATASFTINDKNYVGISSLPVLRRFVPPPGWRGHIEADSR